MYVLNRYVNYSNGTQGAWLFQLADLVLFHISSQHLTELADETHCCVVFVFDGWLLNALSFFFVLFCFLLIQIYLTPQQNDVSKTMDLWRGLLALLGRATPACCCLCNCNQQHIYRCCVLVTELTVWWLSTLLTCVIVWSFCVFIYFKETFISFRNTSEIDFRFFFWFTQQLVFLQDELVSYLLLHLFIPDLEGHPLLPFFSLVNICLQQVPNPKTALILRDGCAWATLFTRRSHNCHPSCSGGIGDSLLSASVLFVFSDAYYSSEATVS